MRYQKPDLKKLAAVAVARVDEARSKKPGKRLTKTAAAALATTCVAAGVKASLGSTGSVGGTGSGSANEAETFEVVIEGNVLHFPIAHRHAAVGTIHKWGDGHHYRKTTDGWELVKEPGATTTTQATHGGEPVEVRDVKRARPATAPWPHDHAVVDTASGTVHATFQGQGAAEGHARRMMRDHAGKQFHVETMPQGEKPAQPPAALPAREPHPDDGYIKGPEQLDLTVGEKPEDVSGELHAGILAFAKKVRDGEAANLVSNGYTNKVHAINHSVNVHYKRGYAYVDVGRSGRYMVATKAPAGKLAHLSPGDIVGIKGYGVPHAGHRYGNAIKGTTIRW